MANTYTLIEGKTLTTATASVTFTSIPQTYTDLLLKVSARNDTENPTGSIYFNSDTTNTNYNVKRLLGDGSAASSNSYNASYSFFVPQSIDTASVFSNAEIYIPNYTVSGIKKSTSSDSVTENNATTAYAVFFAELWDGTGAITSLQVKGYDNFVSGSTFYLYGISNS